MAVVKTINPWLKQGLELGPPLLFFVAYLRLQETTVPLGGAEYDGFIIATAAFVPILLVSIAILWTLTGKLSRIQVFTAIMVVFFGGLTVWLRDRPGDWISAGPKLAAIPDGGGAADGR